MRVKIVLTIITFIFLIIIVIVNANLEEINPLHQHATPPHEKPKADFIYTITHKTVVFTDTSTDDGFLINWFWTFGDGGNSTLQHPMYNYTGYDLYTISLTVTDNQNQTNVTTQTLAMKRIPPTANFTCSSDECYVPDLIAFTDTSQAYDATITEWYWDFGDNNHSSTQHATHSYAHNGTYTVTFTVTDSYNLTNATSLSIRVTDQPVVPEPMAPPSPASPPSPPSRPSGGGGSPPVDDEPEEDLDDLDLHPLTNTSLFSGQQDYLINVFDDYYFNNTDTVFGQAMAQNRTQYFVNDNCYQSYYFLMFSMFPLLQMWELTDEDCYIIEAKNLADEMMEHAIIYNCSWAHPSNQTMFDDWVESRGGEIHYWYTNTSCFGGVADGYRYLLNEQQGLRCITKLARSLQEHNDSDWQKYYHFSTEFVEFYAYSGNGNPLNKLEGAFDKRLHYAMNCVDLWKTNGDARYEEWAILVFTDIIGYYISEDDYLDCYWNPGSIYGTVDTAHANRCAQSIVYGYEHDLVYDEEWLRKIVMTFLFKIHETDPDVEIIPYPYGGPDPVKPFPNLYKNKMDGANQGDSKRPPYGWGIVGFGWNELGRYDDRVRLLMENMLGSILNETLLKWFQEWHGSGFNNQNYNYVLYYLAETLYQMQLAGVA